MEAGVTNKSIGQNVLNGLRQQTSRPTSGGIRGALGRKSNFSSASNPQRSSLATANSTAPRGAVVAAPIGMVNQYAKARGVAISPAMQKQQSLQQNARHQTSMRTQVRNPFRSAAAGSNTQQQALALALKLEEDAKKAREREKLRVANTIRIGGGSEKVASPRKAGSASSGATARPVRVTEESRETPQARQRPREGQSSAVDTARERKPSPPAAAVVSTPPVAAKRKAAPNIFMANKRGKR